MPLFILMGIITFTISFSTFYLLIWAKKEKSREKLIFDEKTSEILKKAAGFAGVVIWIFDRDLRLVLSAVPSSFARIFAVSVPGSRLEQVLPADIMFSVKLGVREVLETAKPASAEGLLALDDGNILLASYYLPVKGRGGEVVAVAVICRKVTEETIKGQKAEGDIRLKDLMVKSLADAVSECGFVLMDNERKILHMNTRARELLDLDEEDAAGEDFGRLFQGKCRNLTGSIFETAGKEQSRRFPLYREIVIRKSDGAERLIGLTIKEIRGEDGGLAGFLGVVTDITADKEREFELAAAKSLLLISEKLIARPAGFENLEEFTLLILKCVLEYMPFDAAVCLIRKGEEVKFIAESDNKLAGLLEKLKDLCTKNSAFFAGELYDGKPEVLKGPGIEEEISTSDNFGTVLAVPLMSSDETLGSMILTSKQKTELTEKMGETLRLLGAGIGSNLNRAMVTYELKKSEARYRKTYEMLPDMLWEIDPEGTFLRANPACERILGFSPSALIGKNLQDFVMPADAGRARIFLENLNAGRTILNYSLRFVNRKGEVKNTIMGALAVNMDVHGRRVHMGVCRDVTEQLRLEIQLRHAQKMRAVGTLAGGIAHDFNNILQGLLGLTTLLKLDESMGEENKKILREMEKTILKASDLTSRLLSFGKRSAAEPRPVDLNQVILNIAKILERTIDKRTVLKLELGKDLPPVQGDPSQLDQVIMNLSINAKEAMPDGGELTISTKRVYLDEEFCKRHPGAKVGEYIRLRVSDTGMGMDEETVSRIFEPFFTTKERGMGAGLGLSIVYGIVEGLGGCISVWSEPGKGSSFDVYLPISKGDADQKGEQEAVLSHGSGTILVVDDEDVVREVLAEMLKKLGYRVILAADGREAVKIFEESYKDIDLVIIDLNMPVMNGYDTFRELKRVDPGVRSLLATGFSMDGSSKRLLDEGVLGFLHKPFTIEKISAAIKEILEKDHGG